LSTLKALILDTSAFIQGFDSNDRETKLYTTPLVLDEIRDEMAQIRALNWSQTGKLSIQMPEEQALKYVYTRAQSMGEARTLSETDHSVLSLTYQLSVQGNDVTLVSDDYSVQNMADELELKYAGMNTRGIKRRFQWIHYCPGCRKQYDKPQQDNTCPICGTELKRKPGKKSTRRSGE
jgi:UPF0271 protein